MTSAYQLQKSDIRINSLCPGLTETGMTDATFEYARQRGSAAKIGQLNALGRFGVAEGRLTSLSPSTPTYRVTEIAHASLFLASGKNRISTRT